MSDIKKCRSVKDVASNAALECEKTDHRFAAKEVSVKNNRLLAQLRQDLGLTIPEKETTQINREITQASYKGNLDKYSKTKAFNTQLKTESRMAREVSRQSKDTKIDASILEKTAIDLGHGQMRSTVQNESDKLSTIADELSNVAQQASDHLNRIAQKDNKLCEKSAQDSNELLSAPDHCDVIDMYDKKTGTHWGKITKVNKSGSIHITQTNANAANEKARNGAHVTTQVCGKSFRDYFDKDGNNIDSDY